MTGWNASRLVWLVVLLAAVGAANAQDDPTVSYVWESTGLALAYPGAWEAPVAVVGDARDLLLLAQTLPGEPTIRPATVDAITLAVWLGVDPAADLGVYVVDALNAQFTPPSADPIDVPFAQTTGLGATGVSNDGTLFGVARAARLDDGRVLVASGRTVRERRAAFLRQFDALTASIAPTDPAAAAGAPTFGVVWFNASAPGDAVVYTNLNALAFDASNGQLYAADAESGLLRVDPAAGVVSVAWAGGAFASVTDMAVVGGEVLMTDPTCACLLVWAGSAPSARDLGPIAPVSIAATDAVQVVSGVDTTTDAVVIIVNETRLTLEGQTTPPELAARSDGRIVALTADGSLLEVTAAGAVPLAALAFTPPIVTDLAALPAGDLVATTRDQGVIVIGADGTLRTRIGQIVPNFVFAGEVAAPAGVAVGAETVYIADSDGAFGALTAYSTAVAPNRVGASALVADNPVEGLLTAAGRQQAWTYTGTAGEQIALTAADAARVGMIDPLIRLYAPDGTLLRENDDADPPLLVATDAHIAWQTLPADGTYIVLVEALNGEGAYTLGVTRPQPAALNESAATTLTGTLTDAVPVQRWRFDAQAAARLSITMLSPDGALDPIVRLYAPDGTLLAENDDADDAALGRNAQLLSVVLPADGTYTLEAARFDGEGAYELVIVPTG